jgi:hypothetical protein
MKSTILLLAASVDVRPRKAQQQTYGNTWVSYIPACWGDFGR